MSYKVYQFINQVEKSQDVFFIRDKFNQELLTSLEHYLKSYDVKSGIEGNNVIAPFGPIFVDSYYIPDEESDANLKGFLSWLWSRVLSNIPETDIPIVLSLLARGASLFAEIDTLEYGESDLVGGTLTYVPLQFSFDGATKTLSLVRIDGTALPQDGVRVVGKIDVYDVWFIQPSE